MRTFLNVVDGVSVPAAGGRTLDITDPRTGEVYATSPNSGPEDVDAAFRSAQRAFDAGWGTTTPGERMAALLRLADAVQEHADELVELEVRDTGKPRGATRVEELDVVTDQFRFFAGAARLPEGKASGEYVAGHTSAIRREPIGVVGAVTPWNYPLMMACWKIAPALAAGNTLVLKPSDTTPASTVRLAEIAAGVLPPGVLNVVCGDRETGAALASHPTPGLVAITGSTRAGEAVAAAAAANVTRVHLELGGNAPVVVFDDVDVADTAARVASAAFFNAGQDCTAATRLLVHESIADEFAEALAEAARATRFSVDEDDSDALFLPPLNNADQHRKVVGMLQEVPQHATVLAGGAAADGPGWYVPATVVHRMRPDDQLVREEIFGPVATVQTFADEAEALRLANGTEYGLASSVWTRDAFRAQRMSRALDFGCVWVNTHMTLVAEMPHGGFKRSGYGKDLSAYSLEDYTRVKHVMTRFED